MADLWLAPRVGTDAALALAMTHVLIARSSTTRPSSRAGAMASTSWPSGRPQYHAGGGAKRITGVPAEQIVAAARMYADGPSTFVSGHGIDAFSAGVQTFRAYHCLRRHQRQRRPARRQPAHAHAARASATTAICCTCRSSASTRRPRQRTIGADRFPLWAGPKGWQTACHNPSVIEAMLTGKPYPVRALYASGVNILVTYPDTRRTIEALRSLDFVAVAAHAMTPTAEYADIVLPKTTTLEEEEVSFMPSGPTVLFTRAVVPPQGEARSEIDIALPLLEKMAERQAITRTCCRGARSASSTPICWATAASASRSWSGPAITQVSAEPVTPARRPFATPTGKIELYLRRPWTSWARSAARLRGAEPRERCRRREAADAIR